jgi:hypothetical protein
MEDASRAIAAALRGHPGAVMDLLFVGMDEARTSVLLWRLERSDAWKAAGPHKWRQTMEHEFAGVRCVTGPGFDDPPVLAVSAVTLSPPLSVVDVGGKVRVVVRAPYAVPADLPDRVNPPDLTATRIVHSCRYTYAGSTPASSSWALDVRLSWHDDAGSTFAAQAALRSGAPPKYSTLMTLTSGPPVDPERAALSAMLKAADLITGLNMDVVPVPPPHNLAWEWSEACDSASKPAPPAPLT